MRILVVGSRLPYPPSWGSSMRGYQLARLLARRHDVTMLCYADARAGERAAAFAPELSALRLVLQPADTDVRARRSAQTRALLSRWPYLVATENSSEMQAAIDEITSTAEFDSIQIEALSMSGFRFPREIPLVLSEHNIEYEILQRMSVGERSAVRRFYNRLEFAKLRRYEQRVWRSVGGCAITSEREARIVRSVAPQTPTVAAANGVDADFFTPWAEPPLPDTLVFTGLLSYRPNVDAVHYLVEDILPLVQRARPNCTLTIVGGRETDVVHLARPGVEFTGYVPDLRPFLGRASVALAPIRMGSGTRLKVVEALAMAKPMVSTSIGCEGIDVHDGEHILVRDSAEAFAAGVVHLLEQPDAAREMGARGAVLARDEYSWTRSADVLEELHLRVVEKRQRAG